MMPTLSRVVFLPPPAGMTRTPTVTRTVRVVVPPGSQHGVPITITVVATDAGLQRTSQIVQTGRSVVDRSGLHDP